MLFENATPLTPALNLYTLALRISESEWLFVVEPQLGPMHGAPILDVKEEGCEFSYMQMKVKTLTVDA